MDIDELATKMSDDILKSVNREGDPIKILVVEYLKKRLYNVYNNAFHEGEQQGENLNHF